MFRQPDVTGGRDSCLIVASRAAVIPELASLLKVTID
jgi:hypothetical protein